MATDRTNPITAHEIILMPPSPKAPTFYGWIRLINGEEDAGYVYLQEEPMEGRMGSTGYIVTALPPTRVDLLLVQLRAGTPLQIRIAGADGNNPMVFIEPPEVRPSAGAPLALPEGEAALLGIG